MHYFKRNIGDYHKKAGRLSMLEHGAYTLLIDACYDREIFPTRNDAIRWCWAKTVDEIAAVDFVLSQFFELIGDRYVQNRIQEEIDDYYSKASKNKEIALKRESDRRTNRERRVHEPCTDEHESPPNHKPLTINQEPLVNNVIPTESPDAPIQEIVLLFNKCFPDLPQVQKISETRRKTIRQRWIQNPELQSLEKWEKFFIYIGRSDFLMGRTSKPFGGLCFDWIMNSANFIKIYEGNYHGEQK